MACDMMCHGCPFDFFSEESDKIQNYGCLPSPMDIVYMRVEHGKSWACHDDNTKPCVGAIQYLLAKGKPFKVIDKELVTEDHAWHLLCEPRIEE